jgi:DNA modification methylase
MAQTAVVEDSLRIDHAEDDRLPSDLADDDVRYPPQLVEHFLNEYTEAGEVVLDPFAGFGTTAVVAERMGRRPICIELLPERAAFIQSRVPAVDVITGDARDLASMDLGPVDFVMTSPPYMTRNDHPQDPMTGYLAMNADYSRYLVEMREVFAQVAEVLTPGRRAVINVANLLHAGVTTDLAWDVKAEVCQVLTFEREVRVMSDEHPAHIKDEYCLVFRR